MPDLTTNTLPNIISINPTDGQLFYMPTSSIVGSGGGGTTINNYTSSVSQSFYTSSITINNTSSVVNNTIYSSSINYVTQSFTSSINYITQSITSSNYYNNTSSVYYSGSLVNLTATVWNFTGSGVVTTLSGSNGVLVTITTGSGGGSGVEVDNWQSVTTRLNHQSESLSIGYLETLLDHLL